MGLARLPLIIICLLSLPACAHTNVTAEQAKDLIDSTDDLVVVDVREPYEYCDARGHIPGALNFPWNSSVLQARYEELLLQSPILVVCRSGGRSNAAANFLDSKGFATVYDMLGGMSAWVWETIPCKYAGGSGTADDPYQIAMAADLIALGETPDDYDKHFILTADIDLDPNLPGGNVFDKAVIAPYVKGRTGYVGTPFTGVFDGNGHAISRLTVAGESYLGLFGKLGPGAEVSGLGVEAVDIEGTGWCIGGLVGDNVTFVDDSIASEIDVYYLGGTITACYSTGTVTSTYESHGLIGGDGCVAGLVGNNAGLVRASYSTCGVSGGGPTGGVVGYNHGSITVSYNTGLVRGDYGYCQVGGLVGVNVGSVEDCYSTGKVTGTQIVGGLVGDGRDILPEQGDTIGTTTMSIWDMETSGQTESEGGTGKTTAEMQTASTFLDAGWDFVDETENGPNDVWKMWDGYDYPRLAWEPGPSTPLVFVDINDPGFCGQMSKYEVTNAQYCDFLNAALASRDITVDGNGVRGANGSNGGTDYAGQLYYDGDGPGYTGYGATNGGAARIHYSAGGFSVDEGFDNHPVSYVSWYGAMAFAKYYGYYLPTEDQWQAVADYDGTYIYGCGETIDPGIANYRLPEHPDGTTSVGSFGQYGYGMSDMAGNVWEWTSSSLDSNRVFRGGSLGSIDSDCDVSIRGEGIPHVAYWDVGFRVCR
jgi:rhodanese-related sulfurtransferase